MFVLWFLFLSLSLTGLIFKTKGSIRSYTSLLRLNDLEIEHIYPLPFFGGAISLLVDLFLLDSSDL